MVNSILIRSFSDRVHLMRHEDICLNGSRASETLQIFLDLENSPSLEEFARQKTQPSKAFEWRHNIRDDDISEVQVHCFDSMKKLGYIPMTRIIENKANDNYKLIGVPLIDFQ